MNDREVEVMITFNGWLLAGIIVALCAGAHPALAHQSESHQFEDPSGHLPMHLQEPEPLTVRPETSDAIVYARVMPARM